MMNLIYNYTPLFTNKNNTTYKIFLILLKLNIILFIIYLVTSTNVIYNDSKYIIDLTIEEYESFINSEYWHVVYIIFEAPPIPLPHEMNCLIDTSSTFFILTNFNLFKWLKSNLILSLLFSNSLKVITNNRFYKLYYYSFIRLNKNNRNSYLLILFFSNLISILLTYIFLTIDFKELFNKQYFEDFTDITSEQTTFTSDQDKITSGNNINETIVTEETILKNDTNIFKLNKYWILGGAFLIITATVLLWYTNIYPFNNPNYNYLLELIQYKNNLLDHQTNIINNLEKSNMLINKDNSSLLENNLFLKQYHTKYFNLLDEYIHLRDELDKNNIVLDKVLNRTNLIK